MKLVNGCPLPHEELILHDNDDMWYSVDRPDGTARYTDTGFPWLIQRFVVGQVEDVMSFVFQQLCYDDVRYTLQGGHTIVIPISHYYVLHEFYREVCLFRHRFSISTDFEIKLTHNVNDEFDFSWQSRIDSFRLCDATFSMIDGYRNIHIPFATLSLILADPAHQHLVSDEGFVD